MAAGPGAEAAEAERLPEVLEAAWRLLDEVEGGAEASSGAAAVQSKVQRGIALLERAARALAQLDLFSRHEELEEVATADLRFMLVPALLGALVLRQVSPERRLEHLRRARACFMDFLRLGHDYGVARFALPPEPDPQAPEPGPQAGGGRRGGPASEQAALVAMAASRRAKIERVFGAGYPSLATMSVNDWYEQHQKQGALPDQGISRAATAGTEEQQKDLEEEAQEEGEEDSVWKAREWDDWKDVHPRGYGNRKNMG